MSKCTCGNSEFFACTCKWSHTHPGISDYACEHCGIYTASAPMCNKCEDMTEIHYETKISGFRRIVTKRRGVHGKDRWETYLLAHNGAIISGPVIANCEREAEEDHDEMIERNTSI